MTHLEILEIIAATCRHRRDASQSAPMARYMKDQFSFYGIKSPARREVVTKIWNKHKEDIRQQIRPLVNALWSAEQRENQYIAMDLMQKTIRQFDHRDIPFFEKLIVSKSWWDTVDWLASHAIGSVLKSYTHRKAVINQWMTSGNIWLIRTCILFQLKYKDEVDEDILYTCIEQTLGSKEFFINKASGWALRQYSKYNPGSVRTFIASHAHLHPLTVREGSKYI